MPIRHQNRMRSKVMPKAWQNCSTKPRWKKSKRERRDRRVTDRRESIITRETMLGRHTARSAVLEVA